MTRDQIVTLVTKTVGQEDAANVSLCNDYVQRAYEMVWNAQLWRDTVTIDTSATISQGVNTFNLPSGFDRIISLQLLSAGVPVAFLDPTTSTFILQTEPTALTTQAVPTKYEEFVHTDGTKKVRIFPLPNAAYTFTLSGKRTCPTLGASDQLQIRNIDNAVIALATSDMYVRLRQLGKAAEMAKKAGAFIEEARGIELEQSNHPRDAKIPTVTTNTLSEMADAVCARVGSWTPDTGILAKNFLRRRYRMIYDAHLWKESVTTVDSATVSAQAYITMPAGLERAISVLVNGSMMEPIDAAYLMQTDPTIFTRSGIPTVFEEYDVAGVKRIRLLPIPDAVYTVTVAGKKTVTNLTSDSDVSVIRNIDTTLIAFAASDLFMRLGKAQESSAALQEATAALQTAKEIEAQQTTRARMSKPLTVAGNSLAEMADAVADRTGQYTLDALISIKDFLRRNYQAIWDMCNWSEATVMANVTPDGSELILPGFFDRVISVRSDVNLGQLSVVEPSLYFGIAPNIFEQTGTALAFSYLTPVAVRILPPTREKLAIKSSSASDKSSVFVMGEVAGDMVSETVVLNGTTEVNTVNDYDTPLTIAKALTVGDVRIRAQTSDIVLSTILASEREHKHMRLWLQPTPSATQTCLVLGKRTIKPLVRDEDTPLLRDIQAALIAASCADMFAKIGKDKAATEARAQAQGALKVLVDLETNQGAYSAQVVPEVEYCYTDSCADDWFLQKI